MKPYPCDQDFLDRKDRYSYSSTIRKECIINQFNQLKIPSRKMIVKKNQDEFQNCLSDSSNYQGTAEAVYLPESEEEIIELVKKFNTDRIRITVSGNGTGLTGARVPEGGVVLSTEKMDKIIELNEVEKYLRVQPGMILKYLQDYVEEKHLFYPPDPTERNCFIGATVATNSSGARSFKYGPTRDYVIGLRVVLPSGETISIERGKIFAFDYSFAFPTDFFNDKKRP